MNGAWPQLPLAWTLWAAFAAAVVVMLAIDLVWLGRRRERAALAGRQTLGDAALFSAFVLVVAAAFAAGLGAVSGRERALAFVAGFLVEEALSVDNLFVFLMIFGHFRVPTQDQPRVLFWGIAGALVLRAAFIAAGAALVARFHWIFYVFGALLLVAAAKMLRPEAEAAPADVTSGLLARTFRRLVPCTPELVGSRLAVYVDGRLHATPLLLVLLLVEASDIVFALDSIPAVFAITSDPFVVYTSNVFAIMGLRSLYALLAGMLTRFVYLKVGLGAVLLFIGAKMLLQDVVQVSVGWSLAVVALCLSTSVAWSFLRPPGARDRT